MKQELKQQEHQRWQCRSDRKLTIITVIQFNYTLFIGFSLVPLLQIYNHSNKYYELMF